MLKKIPLRLRLTLVSVTLLTVCCLGLTVLLNFSANRMADVIEAVPITPAKSIEYSTPATEDGVSMMQQSIASVAARQGFLSQSLFWMVGVVLLGGILTWFVTGRALSPLNELNAQMKNRTQYNLSERLPVPESNDEIASLTDSFNEMSEKLNDAFVTQKRFSQSAAHELRTPLTVLKTKLDVFRKKPNRTQEEYDTLLGAFEVQINRLSGLVGDLLNLTSMDALECEEEIALQPMFSEIMEELSDLAEKRNISVSLSCDVLTVKGNQSLLQRAIYNLVENSIKYNQTSGAITIAAKPEHGRTHISIVDTGTGIAEDQKALIFEPFYRVDKSRSRQLGGAGLGLSTVKAIIDKHGGEIVVSDNPVGGSIFTVIL